MTDKKLSVVIPAFSGHEQIRRCLESLHNSLHKNIEIVLVDHGVSDEITQLVNKEFPRVTCIRASSRLWWSGATNIGITHSLEKGSELIMLLNHDCYVRPDTTGKLLTGIAETTNAIIAPVQHNLRTKREVVGATSCLLLGFSTIILPASWHRFLYSKNLIPTRLVIGGRGVLIPAAVFRKVGLFDEQHLPHYGADHDFYFRCRESGIKLFICANARVDIDDTKTSLANLDNSLSPAEFTNTLGSRHSHRNVKDVYALFSRHYPIPGLAVLGVALNLLRFLLVNLTKRLVDLRH